MSSQLTPQQACPFSVELLHDTGSQDDLLSLLPASYRDSARHVAVPASKEQVAECLDQDLDLRRLRRVEGLLWFAGLPLPPRPLHLQLQLNRDIFAAEQMDLHLVWTDGRIFIKPLPRYLLSPRFWNKYLCCLPDCSCGTAKCQHKKLRDRAVGLLFSYSALISHESDFHIALERRLLPQGVSWRDWRVLVAELRPADIYRHVDSRFYHGELRLSRLNKIYALWQTPGYGYVPRWNRYNAFFRDNFSWLAATTVYIALVLTAMQVGQGTGLLADNDAFDAASYGFAVFSILGPLVSAALIFLVFSLVYVYNWVVSRRLYRTELQRINGLLSSTSP